MSHTSLKVVFAGTPEFAVPTLQALLTSMHRVIAVYTQPDRPAGRGQKLQASPVKICALEHAVSVCQPQNFSDPLDIAALAELKPDVMVVVAYGLILPKSVLDIPRYGCINVHASLLPRWRGAAPIHRALLSGDKQTGISIMQMNEGLDTGDVLSMQQMTITEEDTTGTLHDHLAGIGARELVKVLDGIADDDRPVAQKQDESLATYADKLTKAEALVDWQQPAVEIARRVRAFNPWPIAHTLLDGKPLRIWQAEVIEGNKHTAGPGKIVAITDEELVVSTGQGLLAIQQLQPAGKRVMSSGEFINARRSQLGIGTQLG